MEEQRDMSMWEAKTPAEKAPDVRADHREMGQITAVCLQNGSSRAGLGVEG